jgi:hypothetical protein
LVFPLRIDPCSNTSPSDVDGDERSVGHGIFEYYPSMA